MRKQIKQIILDSNLWNNGGMASHKFILSPDVYKVSLENQNKLETIAMALYDCMAGLGRIITIAFSPRLSHGATWGMIARTLRTGIPSVYHEIMLLNPSRVPSICKVDFMESVDGNYRIAEIDGHNKHGLGYSTLAARIRRAIMPKARVFPGVAQLLSKEIKRRNEDSIVLLYADQERFYLPEFRILQSELVNFGIKLVIVAENNVQIVNNKIVLAEDNRNHRLFVDLPFLYRNHKLSTCIAKLYRNDEIDFLIPPKPFFSSKTILALLRNDVENEELEAILKSQIRPTSLKLLRQYIPETYLIYKHKHAGKEYWHERCNGKSFLLKESISSGMKGTVFADDPNWNKVMERACNSYYHFILQEEVINRAQSFRYFTDKGHLQQGKWFKRITVHYSMRHVADVTVVARQDKKIHGAPDCLQLGTIIT